MGALTLMAPPDRASRPARCPRDETCPSPRNHDDLNGYLKGCRSLAATDANSANSAAYRAGEVTIRYVDATGPVRKLQALGVLGYDGKSLAARAGVSVQQINRVMNHEHGRLHPYTVEWVEALWIELSETEPPAGLVAEKARRLAARKGWAPVEAWDYVDIDDPDARPTGKRRHRRRGTPAPPSAAIEQAAQRRALVVEATRAGDSAELIGSRLGITPRAVQRLRTAARDRGELPKLHDAAPVREAAA